MEAQPALTRAAATAPPPVQHTEDEAHEQDEQHAGEQGCRAEEAGDRVKDASIFATKGGKPRRHQAQGEQDDSRDSQLGCRTVAQKDLGEEEGGEDGV